jgi:hypothetical protein
LCVPFFTGGEPVDQIFHGRLLVGAVHLPRQRISPVGGARYRGQQAGEAIFHSHPGTAIDSHHFLIHALAVGGLPSRR